MKRITSVLISLLLMAALVLTGCGKEEAPAPTTDPNLEVVEYALVANDAAAILQSCRKHTAAHACDPVDHAVGRAAAPTALNTCIGWVITYLKHKHTPQSVCGFHNIKAVQTNILFEDILCRMVLTPLRWVTVLSHKLPGISINLQYFFHIRLDRQADSFIHHTTNSFSSIIGKASKFCKEFS